MHHVDFESTLIYNVFISDGCVVSANLVAAIKQSQCNVTGKSSKQKKLSVEYGFLHFHPVYIPCVGSYDTIPCAREESMIISNVSGR